MINKLSKIILAIFTYFTLSVSSFAFEASNPQCIAPANAGGGWDFTCRSVGKTLQDLKLISGSMEVTNMAGGGGGVAYAEVVNKRGNDNNLIVAASSATATRLAQGAYPGNTMDQVRWLGSVGADYGIIAVSKNSTIKTLPELLAQIKKDPKSITVAGGSAVGGWDHLKVLIAAKKYGIDDVRQIKYVSFDGGGDAVTQLLAGNVQAFTGDVSEAKGFVDSGDIKCLLFFLQIDCLVNFHHSLLLESKVLMQSVLTGEVSTFQVECLMMHTTTGQMQSRKCTILKSGKKL